MRKATAKKGEGGGFQGKHKKKEWKRKKVEKGKERELTESDPCHGRGLSREEGYSSHHTGKRGRNHWEKTPLVYSSETSQHNLGQ